MAVPGSIPSTRNPVVTPCSMCLGCQSRHDLFRDIKVGIGVLNVVVLLEPIHQTEHLLCLLPLEADRGLRQHGNLGGLPPAGTGRDGDLPDQLGKDPPPLGIDLRLLVFDPCPLGVPGHLEASSPEKLPKSRPPVKGNPEKSP